MTRRPRAARALATFAALLVPLGWVLAGPAGPASADARVSIANERGEAKADSTFSTTITVAGSGFQSVSGAMGGVYLFFGTVDPGWRPSQGGRSGVDFRYVPDAETQDNAGFQRFVAFPGSSTAAEAHSTMSASGGWSVTMTVPGPTFQTTGRSGGTETIDCRKVTCGVITVGAHGISNANNETFTPISFVDLYSSGGPDEPDEGAAQQGEDADGETAAPGTPAEPVVDVDRATAVVGRVMTFTAQDFSPGEQVVGSLGAGLAAVGPLVAGAQGEVAGVLQLPADLRAGTHTLTLTGAATSARAEVTFQVAAAPRAPAAAAPVVAQGGGGVPGEWIGLGAAALVLVVVIVVGLVTARRDRRARRRPPAPPALALASSQGAS